jgi:anti-sigma B factor antagonist
MDPDRPAAAQAFDVETIEDRAQVLVRVVGELDLVTSPVLDRHLAGAVGRGRPRVVVDLAGVPFLDVRGLDAIVAADAAARRAGSTLVLRGGGEQLVRLVEVCGLRDRLTIE